MIESNILVIFYIFLREGCLVLRFFFFFFFLLISFSRFLFLLLIRTFTFNSMFFFLLMLKNCYLGTSNCFDCALNGSSKLHPFEKSQRWRPEIAIISQYWSCMRGMLLVSTWLRLTSFNFLGLQKSWKQETEEVWERLCLIVFNYDFFAISCYFHDMTQALRFFFLTTFASDNILYLNVLDFSESKVAS